MRKNIVYLSPVNFRKLLLSGIRNMSTITKFQKYFPSLFKRRIKSSIRASIKLVIFKFFHIYERLDFDKLQKKKFVANKQLLGLCRITQHWIDVGCVWTFCRWGCVLDYLATFFSFFVSKKWMLLNEGRKCSFLETLTRISWELTNQLGNVKNCFKKTVSNLFMQEANESHTIFIRFQYYQTSACLWEFLFKSYGISCYKYPFKVVDIKNAFRIKIWSVSSSLPRPPMPFNKCIYTFKINDQLYKRWKFHKNRQ